MNIIGGIFIVLTALLPNLVFGTSYNELFFIINKYSESLTHTLVDTALYQSSIAILYFCGLSLVIGILFIAIDYIMNRQTVKTNNFKNNLNWKEKYKQDDLNAKITTELENAYLAIQDLKQRIANLEQKDK